MIHLFPSNTILYIARKLKPRKILSGPQEQPLPSDTLIASASKGHSLEHCRHQDTPWNPLQRHRTRR